MGVIAEVPFDLAGDGGHGIRQEMVGQAGLPPPGGFDQPEVGQLVQVGLLHAPPAKAGSDGPGGGEVGGDDLDPQATLPNRVIGGCGLVEQALQVVRVVRCGSRGQGPRRRGHGVTGSRQGRGEVRSVHSNCPSIRTSHRRRLLDQQDSI